jgi:hypothetical protein
MHLVNFLASQKSSAEIRSSEFDFGDSELAGACRYKKRTGLEDPVLFTFVADA